jgi:glycosyltransferase involved in cell wall biosynthesis
MKKKILIMHDVYEHVGGAETYIFEIIPELKKEFDVCTLFQSFETEKNGERDLVYKNKKLPKIKKYFSYYVFDIRFYNFLKKKLKEINPDLIHIHHNNLHPFPVLNLVKEYKTIQTVHDYGIICPKNIAVYGNNNFCVSSGINCIKQKCLSIKDLIFLIPFKIKQSLMKKRIDLIIAPSTKLKESLIQNDFTRVKVLNYFIDLSKWKKISKSEVYSAEKEKKILFVGGLTKHKGAHVLIEAISKIPQEIQKSIHLQIIGKGNYEKELKKQVKDSDIHAKVSFLGYKNNNELPKFYSKAYMMVMPSTWTEQFGIIGLEAMACSTPCIGSNIGGIPEWLTDKKNGLLFEPGNSSDLKEKIIFLLKNPKIAEKYGKNGRKIAEDKFSKKEHIKELIKIYKELI